MIFCLPRLALPLLSLLLRSSGESVVSQEIPGANDASGPLKSLVALNIPFAPQTGATHRRVTCLC